MAPCRGPGLMHLGLKGCDVQTGLRWDLRMVQFGMGCCKMICQGCGSQRKDLRTPAAAVAAEIGSNLKGDKTRRIKSQLHQVKDARNLGRDQPISLLLLFKGEE